jgi:DNA-binding SARP family transcriptional activator/predicted ATPase
MSTLQIELLGHFHLREDGEALTCLPQPRQQALLAYLVLHRHAPHSRQRLAFLFWPDTSEAQAYRNLRKALHYLRHALPNADRFLQIDAQIVQWRAAAPFVLDVAQFEQQLTEAERAEQAGQFARLRACLEEAARLYTGDLLPGCYEEWILSERERLRERFLTALTRLIELLEAERDYPAAIRYANQLLRADPLHEAAYGGLMRLHALNGDRASALRVYHTCATILARELGVEPNEQTRAAYEHLLHQAAFPERPAPRPAQAAAREPLVGRHAEWQNLLAAWRRAAAAHPQLLVIAGEAGIGKTRLAEELSTWVSRQGLRAVHARGYAAEGALAYAPVTEWLRSESLRVGWQHLDAVWLSELARLLPELLVEHPELPRPQPLTDSWQRQRLYEALARAVLAQRQALLLALDDLQWCDRETLEWLHYLLRYNPTAALLVVGTVRPEEVNQAHPLTPLLLDLRRAGQVTEIDLGALDAPETATLAAQVARRALNAETAQRLYQATAGNPLFVVEMMRTGAWEEPGAGRTSSEPQAALGSPGMSPKVQAVIQSRFQQLSASARELAHLAAAMGRAFTFEVLAAASGRDEETLTRSLDELWQRRLLREQGVNAYDFSHDRIRDAAYAEISPVRRRQLHRRLAQALEEVDAAQLDAVSGQIAAHYEQAGLPAEALPYYQRAAEAAQRVYAHAEAAASLARGRALLEHLPLTPERLRQELRLQLALGISTQALKGTSSPELREVYLRAQALGEEVGDDLQQFIAVFGLYGSYLTQGEVQMARALADQEITLAQRLGDRSRLAEAYGDIGIALLHLGQLTAGRAYLERGLGDADYQWQNATGLVPVQHTGSTTRRHLVLALWLLGYPEQALRQIEETLALVEALAHPYSLAAALVWSAWLHQMRREPRLAQVQAERAIAHAQQQGFRNTESLVILGWALAQQGQVTAGIAQIRQGLERRRAMEAWLHQPAFLALLAECYGLAGQPEQGLSVLEEGLSRVAATGERWTEAELHRLQGELLQMSGADAEQVEGCFQQALVVARQQEAKSLELRAAISLGRLWQQQGKRTQAHDLLAGVYAWFSEGFDTPDLQDANALLAALA